MFLYNVIIIIEMFSSIEVYFCLYTLLLLSLWLTLMIVFTIVCLSLKRRAVVACGVLVYLLLVWFTLVLLWYWWIFLKCILSELWFLYTYSNSIGDLMSWVTHLVPLKHTSSNLAGRGVWSWQSLVREDWSMRAGMWAGHSPRNIRRNQRALMPV